MRGDEEQLREEAKMALKSRENGGLTFKRHRDEKGSDLGPKLETAFVDDKVEGNDQLEGGRSSNRNTESLGDAIELQALHAAHDSDTP